MTRASEQMQLFICCSATASSASQSALRARGTGVSDEASDGQQRNRCEPHDAVSLLRPPFNYCLSAFDSHKGHCNPCGKWDEGDNTECFGRPGS